MEERFVYFQPLTDPLDFFLQLCVDKLNSIDLGNKKPCNLSVTDIGNILWSGWSKRSDVSSLISEFGNIGYGFRSQEIRYTRALLLFV